MTEVMGGLGKEKFATLLPIFGSDILPVISKRESRVGGMATPPTQRLDSYIGNL
jgi:hypothetical protein